jgi:D-serine deaminase-like pyridoxal phosphate-dependent protein
MAFTDPSQEELQRFYIGRDISDVPKPAAILDIAIIKRHCETMLRTIKALNVGFRAHVKSHKVRDPSHPIDPRTHN